VPPSPISEKPQKCDTQHDVRDHQRRQEERGQRVAAGELVAGDGKRRGHRKGDRDHRRSQSQQYAVPEGLNELG
jgi:hypothetical protein